MLNYFLDLIGLLCLDFGSQYIAAPLDLINDREKNDHEQEGYLIRALISRRLPFCATSSLGIKCSFAGKNH